MSKSKSKLIVQKPKGFNPQSALKRASRAVGTTKVTSSSNSKSTSGSTGKSTYVPGCDCGN